MKENQHQYLPLSRVKITGGFWKNRQSLNRHVTAGAVYEQFSKSGRIGSVLHNPGEGEANPPPIAWDSDVFKWMEAMAYINSDSSEGHNPFLTRHFEHLTEAIAQRQEPSGYFNPHFFARDKADRFRGRGNHELYSAGHLMEAAVAAYENLGEKTLLDVACRFADYLETVFITRTDAISPAFRTPGHPEIELALARLYEATGEERYLNMVRYFVDNRGKGDEPTTDPVLSVNYAQDQAPVRQQTAAEGHAVRAAYLYAGMADLARLDGDEELRLSCHRLMDNILTRRMYVTGGIGSAERGEAFTLDYDLPNLSAYSESCAAIALIFFAERLWLADKAAEERGVDVAPHAALDDLIERILYNGFLSSTALSGDAFFYVNPLEINLKLCNRNTSFKNPTAYLPITQRKKVFECSCCPPNITRLVASLPRRIYSVDDKVLYVHQFMSSEANVGDLHVTQETSYPTFGKVNLHAKGLGGRRVMFRIPGWCTSYTATLNGEPYTAELENGYLPVEAADTVDLVVNFNMDVRLVAANPMVEEDAGRVCLCRGPIVYCLEGVDNAIEGMGGNVPLRSLVVPDPAEAVVTYHEDYNCPVIETAGFCPAPSEHLYAPVAAAPAAKPVTLRFIPYFAFANRGESDMLVWIRYGGVNG